MDEALTMIQSPNRVDRLSALVAALAPRAQPCDPAAPLVPMLIVTGDDSGLRDVILRSTLPGAKTGAEAGTEAGALAAAHLSLRIPLASVLQGMPDRLVVPLAARPALAALAQVFVAESQALRCGWAPTLGHLAEAMLIIALRGVIDSYPSDGPRGLLAGLAHPRLHAALAAMHGQPAHPWTTESLAACAGMSRSSFMQVFGETLGTSPMAYLTAWRLTAARAALRDGLPLRIVAQRAGFTSTEGFSRAFRRFHGQPPSHVRSATG